MKEHKIHSRLALTVVDPNIQMREEPSHPDSEIRGVFIRPRHWTASLSKTQIVARSGFSPFIV